MTSDDHLRLLAHELRSPVAALGVLASVAAGGSAADVERTVALAAAAGRDIERLLSDPDVLSLRPEEVELETLMSPFAQRGVTCVAQPALVVCDPTRIRQAVANLVANGLRHGSMVTVTGTRLDAGFAIEVADNGPGIEPGRDVFERGVSGAGSTGYGLWLARAIAEAHVGTLTVESTQGNGATFTLSVPQRPSASD